MKKVAFFDTKPYDREFFTSYSDNFSFSFFEEKLTEQTVEKARGHHAVCVFVNDTINKAVIDSLCDLGVEVVALRCAGYNNVDFSAAYKRIHIVRVPAYSPYAVAEHALALIMTLNRKTHRAYRQTREGNFSITGLMGFDMHGKTAGIIGTGAIGKKLISILQGFGMDICAYDPFPDTKYAEDTGITYSSLFELYAKSDVISLHCPLVEDTYHMINEEALSRMKHGVYIVNTSRGGLVDSEALIRHLKNGKIGAAALDVYEEESEYFFQDLSQEVISDDVLARLMFFPNVLITSHQAFFTREALTNIAKTTVGNLQDFFSGGWLKNEICYRCDKECRKKQKKRCF
ncbi:MAG: 2-hydroxyacid dehydrogenase [Fibrobacterota bacterium]